ncbi:hypothetical protein HOO54_15385 [Bacillus sp. WMMC1349]|uniref:hypothetical protein n=1 Tax=Bacillus sp. WMMC1349 TaxID=2736254 RepID=UPI0015569C6A|nr:hypothetical protein [Bacillus sp. WMMC1349]NPC93583.1 hypothetical protein [Bacillus sp. WMMC1349]
MIDRQKLLKQKLKINKQKSLKIKLMDLLPKKLATVINKSEVIISPEREKILNKVHEKWNFDLHKGDFVTRYSDFRKEFSWEQEVIQFIDGIDIEEKQVYLLLEIDDNSPFFLVDGKWVIKNFGLLWGLINNNDLWVVGQDFSYGFLVSRYGGYLEHDPNPKEIFYAITYW